MIYFTKHYNAAGSSPGQLENGTAATTPTRVDLIRYTTNSYTFESDVDTAAALESWIPGEKLWLAIHGRPAPALLKTLETKLKLHSLALEDVIHAGQRAKLDDYDSHLFLVLQRPRWEDHKLAIGQVSLFLGNDFVVSIDDVGNDGFELIRKRLEASQGGRIRSFGSDYLFYALVDLVVDTAFPVLDGYAIELEELELSVMKNPKQADLLDRLHESRRELVFLRRSLWPQRDATTELLREEFSLISKNTRVYLRDCADHANHLLEQVDSYRDMSVAVMELLISNQNRQLNETMRVLTMIATIFIPLSFVTGLYGMNFDTSSPWNMPELKAHYGYPATLVLLLAMATGMLAYFRRKDWI